MSRLFTATAGLFTALALSTASLACADEGGSPPAGNRATGQTGATASARPATRGKLRTVRVARFEHPVEVKSAPGFPGMLFVVEQQGRVMIVRNGKKLTKPFLNITPRVKYEGGEQGLLSVAFPPDYRRSKKFYVYYNDKAGDIRVVEFRRRTPVRAAQNAARNVITIRHRENANHNGGQLQFLGRDLYFGTGDGGGAGDEPGNAQNLNSLLGKLIRIDPRQSGRRPYTVPSTNPFVSRSGRDEIFSYGLRNPFRWSFDRISSSRKVRIAIGDVGQDAFEEVNYLNLSRARGGNFGWNLREGFEPYKGGGSGTIKPSTVLPHPPNCSVIGGLVVRDRSLPALRGRYVFTDFCNGKVLSFKPRLGRVAGRPTGLNIPSVSSFGESLRGALFVTSLDGSLYRIRQ